MIYRFLNRISSGIKCFLAIFYSILKFDGLVIVAPYPFQRYEKNGYFQRILDVDKKIKNFKRVYINAILGAIQPVRLDKKNDNIIMFIDDKTIIINFGDNYIYRICAYTLSWMFILRCRKIYFHSVYRIEEPFGLCLHFPIIRCYFDIHGAVSAEHKMRGESNTAEYMEKFESLALRKAVCAIYVSNNMRRYFQHTIHNITSKSIVMPIISVAAPLRQKSQPHQPPIIVYAGGTAIWQQCKKMADTIAQTFERYYYRIYISQPDVFKRLLPSEIAEQIEITTKEHCELLQIYPQCQYGLVLRAESVVNRVACPTKLVEYMAYGIVPIVDSPYIGDFVELGMQYVELEHLEKGTLPEEADRLKMAQANRLVFARLLAQHEAGREALLHALEL